METSMIDHEMVDLDARRAAPVAASWKWVRLLAALMVAGLAAVAVYAIYIYLDRAPVIAPVAVSAPPAMAPAPSMPQASPPPATRHPLPEIEPRANEPAALPAFDKSDEMLQNLLANLFGSQSFQKLFKPDDIVRHFVVTVDNLPRHKLNRELSPARPVERSFIASREGDATVIAPANAARYGAWVAAAEAVDPKKLVTLYVRFYPWFQQEYRTLGYPDGAFNDRLVDAIDDLLATPDVSGPLALTQSKVLYEFADPALESLSAGQKLLLRVGPDNAARVKSRLREFRRTLVAASVGQ